MRPSCFTSWNVVVSSSPFTAALFGTKMPTCSRAPRSVATASSDDELVLLVPRGVQHDDVNDALQLVTAVENFVQWQWTRQQRGGAGG